MPIARATSAVNVFDISKVSKERVANHSTYRGLRLSNDRPRPPLLPEICHTFDVISARTDPSDQYKRRRHKTGGNRESIGAMAIGLRKRSALLKKCFRVGHWFA